MDIKTIGMAVGAVLAAVLVLLGANMLVNALYPRGPVPEASRAQHADAAGAPKAEAPAKPAAASGETPAPAPVPAAPETPAAAPAAAEPEKPLAELMAAANVEAGANEAKKCALCHTFEKGAGKKVGPNLYGVLGQPVGKQEGFTYSAAMKAHGGTWDYALLDCYVKNPKACIPGNSMAFAGIKDGAPRANLIAYLRSLSDAPLPLPAP